MTGSMEQRKSRMPEANKMARMLRSGRTLGDLAVRYGVNSNVIIMQLTAHGYDASNGNWVGGDKKDYKTGALSARGDGPGHTCHHVGGGDNPTVVSTATRPFHERRRFTGLDWPARTAVPPEARYQRPEIVRQQAGNNARRKISPEQEAEMAKRYIEDEESSMVLARAYGVNQRTVRKHLEHYGVQLRTRGEALQLRYRQRRAAASVTSDVA